MSQDTREGGAPEKVRPTCPLCAGKKFRREELKVYDASASQKRPMVALVCARCAHTLLFTGASNLYDLA